MRITRLRLTGFKSFVEPAELLIEPGLTGVVGPNGCGKSNLLEAIRWVMGEASPRSLRGGGMEDVIFAGTASRPAREFAEVTIATDGDEGEHEVVRRVERGAGSAYRINGRDVRARDVALLFADAATGAHSPALVSQGRIAAVIAAKPAERREMLEEAAGIAGLHVRRREAELKLRATDANLARLDELLGDMETRGNALRRQAKAAERYRALSADIRVAEARSLFARWRTAAAEAESARVAAERAEQAVSEAAEAQRAAAAHATQAVARAAEARTAADGARETIAEARHRLDGLVLERQGLERRLADLARTAETLARDRAREDRLAIDAAEAIRTLDAEDKALAATLAAAERERGRHDAALLDAERQARDTEVTVAQAHARAAAEAAEVRVAQATLAAARQLAARAESEAARLARDLAGLGERAPLEAALAEAGRAREAAEATLGVAGEQAGAVEQARDEAAAARDLAERDAGIADAALARTESEVAALEKELARGAGQGVLAQLRVAPGHERALAAALGDDLDAPLGDDGPRGWAGAAVAAGDPPLPAGTEPLADHVRGGEMLARRLAQVAVVDEDRGEALAVGQRLVTRAGRLRRWDGFVARDPGAATAERLARANRLDALRAELAGLRASAAGAREALARANDAQMAARRAIEQARAALDRGEQTVRERRRAEDAAGAALDRHGAALAALAERRQHSAGDMAEARSALDAAERAIAALPDGAMSRALAEQAASAAGAARARLGEARAAAAAHAEAIARDARRQQAARGEVRGWRARAGDAARRIDEMDRRTGEVAHERATLTERPDALIAEIEEATHAAQGADAVLADARAVEDRAVTALRETEAHVAQAGEALATAREARAGSAARAEHQESRRIELSRLAGERFDCPAPTLPERIGFDPAGLDSAETEAARHERLAADRERLGPVNLVAESELAELDAARLASAAERDELGQAVNRLRGSIGSLNREGRQRLTAAFTAVDGHFRRLFTTLFAGGEAHLALIDSDDPLEAGLEIMAQPPGKKLGSLTLLSGGEQALTAIALIFALFLTNPAPICVLDEVDAPLDDANIERFCDLLAAMARDTATRYLIVTHNAVTMSRMHRLFGVTMIERGVSRLVSVDLGGAEELLAAE